MKKSKINRITKKDALVINRWLKEVKRRIVEEMNSRPIYVDVFPVGRYQLPPITEKDFSLKIKILEPINGKKTKK